MSKKYSDTSEEKFLKNKARRKNTKTVVEKRKKKNGSGVFKGLKIFSIALACFIGIVLLLALMWIIPKAYIYFFGAPVDHNTHNDTFINTDGETVDRETTKDGSKKYYTFLATATDRAGALTDVIMIARLTYDDKNPAVSVLQIPRDTYVKISSAKLFFNPDGSLSAENFSGSDAKTSIKINEVYYRGKNLGANAVTSLLLEADGKSDSAIEALCSNSKYKFLNVDVDKVKQYAKSSNKSLRKELDNNIRRDFGIHYLQQLIFYNFGIPTDYYAQVNIDGFRGIVDAIGGVDLTVPQRMYYVDEYQDLYIDLYPGHQHLNGKKAEQFVRFRGYVGGDVDRLEAQKTFLNAFLSKLLSLSTVSKIDSIVSEIEDNLYTSISFDNLLVFANKLVTMDLSEDIHMYTIPGTGDYVGAVSYFVLDKDEATILINDQFNVYNKTILGDDLKMIDSSDIYRPANTVKPDDENEDESDSEEVSEETAEDGEDSEDGKEDYDSESTESDVSEENESENEVSDNESSDIEEDTENESSDSDTSSADEVSDNKQSDEVDTETDETVSSDENNDESESESQENNETETSVPESNEPEINEPEADNTEVAETESATEENTEPSDNSHLLENMVA